MFKTQSMDVFRLLLGFVLFLLTGLLARRSLCMIPHLRSQRQTDSDYDLFLDIAEDIVTEVTPEVFEDDLEYEASTHTHDDGSGNIKELFEKLGGLMNEEYDVIVYKPWSAGQHFCDQVVSTLPWMLLSCLIGVVAGICFWIIPVGFYKIISMSKDTPTRGSDESNHIRSLNAALRETKM